MQDIPVRARSRVRKLLKLTAVQADAWKEVSSVEHVSAIKNELAVSSSRRSDGNRHWNASCVDDRILVHAVFLLRLVVLEGVR